MIHAMSQGRLFLFAWSQAEAEAVASTIASWGWQVQLEWQDGGRGSAAVKAAVPDVLVFYLDQKPSHSRAIAEHLANTKATRYIPMVFVGGEDEALLKARSLFPTAFFVDQDQLQATLEGLRPK